MCRPLGFHARCNNPPFRFKGEPETLLQCSLLIGEQDAPVQDASNQAEAEATNFKSPKFELSVTKGPSSSSPSSDLASSSVSTSPSKDGLVTDSSPVVLAAATGARLSQAWADLLDAVAASPNLELVSPIASTNAAHAEQKSPLQRKWRPVDIFGLASPAVVQLVEGLEGAQLCSRYVQYCAFEVVCCLQAGWWSVVSTTSLCLPCKLHRYVFSLHRRVLRVLLHDRERRLLQDGVQHCHPAWTGGIFTSSAAAEKEFDPASTSPVFCGLAQPVSHDSEDAARLNSRCQFCGLPIAVRSKSHLATTTGKRRGIIRHPLMHRTCSENMTFALRSLWKEVRYNLPRAVESALAALKAAAREDKMGNSRGILNLDYEVRGKLLGVDRYGLEYWVLGRDLSRLFIHQPSSGNRIVRPRSSPGRPGPGSPTTSVATEMTDEAQPRLAPGWHQLSSENFELIMGLLLDHADELALKDAMQLILNTINRQSPQSMPPAGDGGTETSFSRSASPAQTLKVITDGSGADARLPRRPTRLNHANLNARGSPVQLLVTPDLNFKLHCIGVRERRGLVEASEYGPRHEGSGATNLAVAEDSRVLPPRCAFCVQLLPKEHFHCGRCHRSFVCAKERFDVHQV